ncbi:MAG: hypothetical protein GWN86_19535 [Desulfobacterales bacterium]|nr:hypothetical protein [Desulfobacterales bacterium]
MVNGKLLIYTAQTTDRERRLRTIKSAASKIAEPLKLQIQVVSTTRNLPTYVYYKKEGDSEKIPVYCDSENKLREKEIHEHMKSILFTLSFHPKHSCLLMVRKELLSAA